MGLRVRQQECKKCGKKWKGIHRRCPYCGKVLTKEEMGENK
jgi:predicted amidophosphoribosyltransferase